LETEKPILPPGAISLEEDVVAMKNTFSELGSEIDEIISKRPPFIVRWGTVYFFFLLLLIGLVSWFIKYPDVITTKAKLTSLNPPKAIVARLDGQLVKLNVREGQRVQKYQVLGYMESTANAETVIYLSGILDSLQNALYNGQYNLLSFSFPSGEGRDGALGELQQPYQIFIQSFILFRSYLENGFYLQKKKLLAKDMETLQRLNNNLYQQKRLEEEDLSLAQQTFTANEQLKDQKVISAFDYRNESSKLIGKKMSLPQITSSIINNEAQQNDKRKEILELDNQIAQQKNIFIQSLNTFISQVDEWKKKYLLISPVKGRIAFSGFIEEHQQLHANQIICFVNPSNSQYYAEIYIPQFNLGKVKTGQQVLLKFSSYPYEEYGSLNGRIDFISTIPTDSGYLAKVILTNGLTTIYNKPIQYREGLQAQGEIITQNMRLSKRFYYNIVKKIRK
jgi:multidrug efflux pump subunit AcrA (membrane-fusion protein)